MNITKILFSLGTIAVVGAAVVGGTGAFFQDTETSTDNVFVAGAIDLKVDHTYAEYNGEVCISDCSPIGENLIVNGGFETPVPTDHGGNWQVYPTGILGWDVVSGSGIEIQANSVAGDPHSGNQLVELDSHTPGDPQTTMEQTISTVPGQGYQLIFYHSPRPNNGPNTDNAVEFTIEVTSTSGVLINETIGQPSSVSGNTQWTEYVYNFLALDTETTIRFADAGSQSDTLGGYLDDVSVRELECSQNPSFPHGGICTLWGERDLGSGDRFWYFPDIKPGDWGKNIISLHVYDNDAYACLFPGDIQDDENGVAEPELTALPTNDTPDDGIPHGELSGELEFFFWHDANGSLQHEAGEEVLVPAGTPFNQIPIEIVQLSLVGNAPIDFVGIEWCAGAQAGPQTTGDTTPVACDGNGMGNIAQTDKMIADLIAYAVQQRNNEGFSCADVDLGGGTPPPPQGPTMDAFFENGPVPPLGDSFFDVTIRLERLPNNQGLIKVLGDGNTLLGQSGQFNVDSFFDIYYEIEVTPGTQVVDVRMGQSPSVPDSFFDIDFTIPAAGTTDGAVAVGAGLGNVPPSTGTPTIFETEMVALDLHGLPPLPVQVTPPLPLPLFGDPDFEHMVLTNPQNGSTASGFTASGQARLVPGDNWNVDSFFDITYRIEN